jgi:uncharacterized protein
MSLKSRINEDMKTAMKARQVERLSAIRLLLAAIKQREVDERVELTDTDVVAAVEKLIKQRRDSIEQYRLANRQDLVDKEQFELSVLEAYLPERLGDAEVAELIERAVQATGATGVKDMGKLMAELKPKLAGRADMAKVSGQVKARLSI